MKKIYFETIALKFKIANLAVMLLLLSSVVSKSQTATKQLYLSDPSQALDRIDPVATADGTTTCTLPVSSVPADVVVDAVSSNFFVDASAAPVASVSHTTGSGTNRLMLVGISHENSVIDSVTYGGTALTKVGDNTSNKNAKIAIYQLVNPPSGTANVTVNFGQQIDKGAVIGVTTFTGVNQTTPLGAFNSAGVNSISPSVTVSSATGELVFDVISMRQETLTIGFGQTQQWNHFTGQEIYGSGSTKPGSSTVTMSWTPSGSNDWAIGAVSIKQAVALTNITFTQSPILCSDLIIKAGPITVKNYVSIVSGNMPVSPNITAVLKYGATTIVTLTNPTYSQGLLTWTGTMASDVNVPSGQEIALLVTTNQSDVAFTIDYDSNTKPSNVEFVTSTFIDIINYAIYNAAYPLGSIINPATAIPIGATVHIRSVVTNPFGNSDITGLNITIPASGSTVEATSVATTACTRTYEYVWNTSGAAAGTVNLQGTARDGYENTVTDVQTLSALLCDPITTPVFDLGSTTTRCQGAGIETYTATSINSTEITYTLDAASIAGGNSIDASSGTVTYTANWTGTSTIKAIAAGCGGPKTANHTVTITPTVAVPVFTLGASSTRCIGIENVTYTATASNSTGITYTLDAASITAGNSINASGTVTYTASWTGTSTITATATGCSGTNSGSHTVTITPTVAVPVFNLTASSTRCQGIGDVTYSATASNSTGITYILDAASITAGNSINASGTVTYTAGWTGTSMIAATAAGCSGPKTATHTITITPVVTVPVFTLGASSTRCQGIENVTYTATANNSTGITYTLDLVSINGGNTIDATGTVTYTAGWAGTSTITASAAGCSGPKTATHTVTITPTVAVPVFSLGTSSIRCLGFENVTYKATASNSTGITYTLDAASTAGGNSIDASSGTVTYTAGWLGTSTITATATGCNDPKTANHKVTITLMVGTPVFASGASSQLCKPAGTVTYSASAINTTGITYSLDAVSLAVGNTINAATGQVIYASKWSGTTIITATAAGCSPTTAKHTAVITAVIAIDDVASGDQGNPIVVNVIANDLCDVNAASVAVDTYPQNGNLQIEATGLITYLPNGNFYGTDQFSYQVCSNETAVCDVAMVNITVNQTFNDPCAEATQSKIYYLPFPENTTQLRKALLSAASVNNLSNDVRTIVSIKVPYPNVIITYDHWEDGYEPNITLPAQATTLVWGDGNLSNGIAPGYPNDKIPAGGYIIIDNQFTYNPRSTSQIAFDGKDKIYTTADVAISTVKGDAGYGGGSPTFDVQNVKTNVYDITRFGKMFVIPFGENITLGGTSAFKYTGIFIRAATNGTVIKLDYNGDSKIDITQTLNEGDVYFYDGTASTPGVFAVDNNKANDIKAGGTVTSTYPVGVDLVFGGIDSYGTRNLALLPGSFYGSTYYSPVHTTLASAPVYAFFNNQLSTPITVNWIAGTGATGSVILPANGSNFLSLSIASGYKFQSAGGESYTAVAVIDADASGSAYDWAFNMISASRLTTFASIAWAPGSNDLSGNYNPVWVTPAASTTLYVKYDGNMVTTSTTMSPCNLPYDIAVPLTALQSYQIFDPDKDQSGMAVYTCDGVQIAAVWGEDPNAGNPTPTGTPAQDVGYVMEPRCLQQNIFANDDIETTPISVPIIIDNLANDLGFLCNLNASSVTTVGLLQPLHGTSVVNSDGTITYTPNLGYEGYETFEYRVCSSDYPDICDVGLVTIYVTDCAAAANENMITGKVFIEKLPDDGLYTPVDEASAQRVRVNLYDDVNGNRIVDAAEDNIEQSTLSDLSGNYEFHTRNGLNAYDNFDPTPSVSGNHGGINWSSNWIEQSDDLNLATGYVRILADASSAGSGNAIRIDGPNKGISRSLNFSSAVSATLKFSFRREGLLNKGEALDVRMNGTTIYTIQDGDYSSGTDVNYTEVIIPITVFNANGINTVFFITNGIPSTTNYFWIDNVELTYFKTPVNYIIKVDPSNTGGAYKASLLNTQTAAFGSIGICDKNNYLGVLAMLVASDDIKNTAIDAPVIINVLFNDVIGQPNPASVTTTGMVNQPANGTVIVNPDGTITYTPNPLFIGTDDFEYQVCSLEDPAVCDIALVTVTVSCISTLGINVICGLAFNDVNLNGVHDAAELAKPGVLVNLYRDTNNNGMLDAGETTPITNKTTNSLGYYQFDVTPPVAIKTYLDNFNANTIANQSNSTSSWTSNSWFEVVENDGFNAGNITITSVNGLKISNRNNGAMRTANLAGAISANLTFKFREVGLDQDVNDYVDVQVATTGSPSNWTHLMRYTGADGNQTGTGSFNISSYISASTTIRFISSNSANMSNGNIVYFDDVQISYSTPTAAKYIIQLAQPIPTGYTLTTPLPSPTGIQTASFTTSGEGVCQKNFGLAGADVQITTSDSPDPVVAGQNLTYTLVVTNNGPANTVGVVVTDVLPAALSGANYTLDGGILTPWASPINLGLMPPVGLNHTHTILITGTVSSTTCASISNTATVLATTTDPVPGNNTSGVVSTTVLDHTLPTITCSTNVIAFSDANLCTASGVILGTPVAADNCSVLSVTNNAPATFPSGNTIVTWTVTDGSGNKATCEQTVTVTDTQNPTIACSANIIRSTGVGGCNASVITPNPTTADNCSVTSLTWDMTGATIANSPATGIHNVGTYFFNNGITTITYTVKDSKGNSAFCAFTVTVNDTQVPSITCATNLTDASAIEGCNTDAIVSVTRPLYSETEKAITAQQFTDAGSSASDNCIINYYSYQDSKVGTCPIIISRTWKVKDAAGNSSSCVQAIHVDDNTPPVLTCPSSPQIRTIAPNITTYTAIGTEFDNFSTSDNCGTVTSDNNLNADATLAGYVFGLGTTSVTWTATDACGNTNTCSFEVFVNSPSLTVANAVDLTTISCPGILTYTITVVNTGNTDLTHVLLTHDLAGTASLISGDVAGAGVLNVGETWTYSATYAATQTDIDSGATLVNTASVITDQLTIPAKDDATTTILPMLLLTVGGSADLCSGTGSKITIESSFIGTSYQLRVGVTNIGAPLAGTGGTISLPTGNINSTTTFNVWAISSRCSGQLTQKATLTVLPIPTATIVGSTSLCQNAVASLITFTNPQLLPITITYNINGINPATINVNASSSVTLAVSTTNAGTFHYNLVSVAYQSPPGCSNSNSGTIAITVNPTLPVSVSIMAFPSGEICQGNSVTFKAAPINEGTTPVYQWYDGLSMITGETGLTYTSTTLTEGNFITVQMTSTASCIAGSPAISNAVSLTVNPLPTPGAIVPD